MWSATHRNTCTIAVARLLYFTVEATIATLAVALGSVAIWGARQAG